MATYWKSQPRKFCDYCKCWITDNKPSVDFHEKGKKHQENVKIRIDEIKKRQGIKDKKEKELKYDMRVMEEAALKAFKQDLVNNPALAAQYGVRLPGDKPENKPEKKKEEEQVQYGPANRDPSEDPDSDDDGDTGSGDGVVEWFEAKSPEGYSYYWNSASGESLWVAPKKYISIAEQEGGSSTAESSTSETPVSASQQEKSESIPAGGATEKLEEEKKEEPFAIPDIPLPISDIPLPGVTVEKEPEIRKERKPQNSAYGSWSQVREEEHIDLNLPTVKVKEEVKSKPIPLDIPKIKFKEKRVASLAPSHSFAESNIGFKKRKFNSGARQMRKRGEDD